MSDCFESGMHMKATRCDSQISVQCAHWNIEEKKSQNTLMKLNFSSEDWRCTLLYGTAAKVEESRGGLISYPIYWQEKIRLELV